jgi:murein L,D-transpeptidase YafK
MRSTGIRFWSAAVAITTLLGASVPSWAADERAAPSKTADRVLIVKSTRTLTLLNHGQVLKSYKVALGGDPVGPKIKAGDKKTPEGEYIIDSKNPHSRFRLALHISYPNTTDRERARKLGVSPGGGVEIHGLEPKYAWVGSLHRQINWTAGCIAVTNPEIEDIYKLVPVGTLVEIRAAEKAASTETVDLKNGNLHLTIPVVASKPKQ